MIINSSRQADRGKVARPFLIFLVFCICTPTACRMMSDYDEVTDNSVSALQKKVDAFLVKLQRKHGKPEGAYAANVDFYDEVKVEFSSIRVRAAARPRNEHTVQQIRLLEDQINLFEEAHREGLSAEEIPQMRQRFDQGFTAILKLELAKKRGESGGDD